MAEIPEYVKYVLNTLESSGHEAWCVGGCVRDLLLGRVPEDWDVTTSALPEETLETFEGHAFPTGLKHGTVTVRIDGHSVEVTTFRQDGEYHDHRRPISISFTRSLEKDLERRDFTVNALALNLRGELRDPWNGQADLQKHVLRSIGTPDLRFNEDALRLLRGLRFSAVLNFEIEPATADSICRNKNLLQEIAAERIQAELFKLLCGRAAAKVLRAFSTVIGVFWPEILPMVGFDQRNYHHCYDVWEHTLHALEKVDPDPILRCAVLLHDIGKPASFSLDTDGVGHFYGHGSVSQKLADDMLRRLKCPTVFRETVIRLVEWHDRDIPRTDKSIRRALRIFGEQDLRRLIAVKRADNLAQAPAFHNRQRELDKATDILDRLLAEDACFSLKQLCVNGNDLTEIGLAGPIVGRVLNILLDAVVNGDLPNKREILLAEAKRQRQ